MIGVQQRDQHIDIQQCAHSLKSADLKTTCGGMTRTALDERRY
jgi:hypothetical protein